LVIGSNINPWIRISTTIATTFQFGTIRAGRNIVKLPFSSGR
jgi:hypothetical protein